MAEGQRMAVADVVERVLAGEHGDFVREAAAIVARELMEAEITQEIGAELGEVSTERSGEISERGDGWLDLRPVFAGPARR